MSERYFDDFSVGEKFSTGGATVTADLIAGFALTYDSQTHPITQTGSWPWASV